MNPYTSLAIDAFRRAEAAKRRADKAEAEALQAQRRIPQEERILWYISTEIIRIEEQYRRDGRPKSSFDQESYKIDQEHLADFRQQLRRAEADLAARKKAVESTTPADTEEAEDDQCTASSWRGSFKPIYGPGGYNRCIKSAVRHDEHKDAFGNVFVLDPAFKILRTEAPPTFDLVTEAPQTEDKPLTYMLGPDD